MAKNMYKATPHRTQKRSKRVALLLGAVLVILAITVGGVYYKHHHANSGPTAAEKAAEKKQDQQTKQQTAERVQASTDGSDSTSSSSSSSSTKPSTGSDSSSSNTTGSSSSTTISANIDRANQQQAGAALSVRATVVGTTSGTCQFTLSKSGQDSFTQNFPVTAGATAASCGNADIPISSFPVSGTWQVQLIIISGGTQSAAVTASQAPNVQK